MKTELVVWTVFAMSSLLCVMVLMRIPGVKKLMCHVGMNLIFAVIFITCTQFLEPYIPIGVPLNIFTLGITTLLGFSGLLSLIALKLVVV
jgi:hypothetical protein